MHHPHHQGPASPRGHAGDGAERARPKYPDVSTSGKSVKDEIDSLLDSLDGVCVLFALRTPPHVTHTHTHTHTHITSHHRDAECSSRGEWR